MMRADRELATQDAVAVYGRLLFSRDYVSG